jgi:hypothetical protein
MRVIGCFALSVVLTACSQSTVPAPARLAGTNALALVGDLLFVASTERNELRVLNLSSSPTREFIRAPNPIEPLSIPVLDRPTAFARDVTYDNGVQVPGPYVYVQGASAAEISIVGAGRSQLLEIFPRYLTPGIVTAIAARGPAGGDSSSTLYFATSVECADQGECVDAPRGNVWRVKIPPLDSTGTTFLNPVPEKTLVVTTQNSVSALLVLPDFSLVVATRTERGTAGRTAVLDQDGGFIRQLNFPSPVRFLATNPRVVRAQTDPPSPDIREGSRVYAILDEDSCGGDAVCSGILCVDVADGQISKDATGYPMLPLTYGGALPQSMALSLGGVVVISLSEPALQYDLLGLSTSSDGRINFFAADALRVINNDPEHVDGGRFVPPGLYLDTDGGTPDFFEGPVQSTIVAANGAAHSEYIYVTYQGTITGFRDLSLQQSGGVFAAPGAPFDGRVVPGDTIVLGGSACPANPPDLPIQGINPDGGQLLADTSDAGQFLSACGTFSVRATDAGQPFIVEGVPITGYMGRTGPNQVFEYHGTYFYHADGYNPNAPTFTFRFDQLDPQIQRDWAYRLQTIAAYTAEYIHVDPGFGIDYHIPGDLVHVSYLPDGGAFQRLFVAYPPANAVVEINTLSIIPNHDNSLGVFPHN